ncbi:MAG: hypothetical protein DI626_02495 [Micavibrio aeruginosavorus]|uniref:Glycosyl hydrolase family 13 catalytic domain-containing protein n=1 Tax=Micavibrio aeruginosavorus TaxID=349221 RepID=A0A2W5BYG9_9BACT|nr:MAG: hypothetical protein DI626_02495 [Micavibrio aeruginosavorus]
MTTTLAELRLETDPFGAKVLPNKNTRFRLWMPQQEKLLSDKEQTPQLVFPDENLTLPMQSIGAGWYELELHAPHGTRYQYRVKNPAPGNDEWADIPDPMSYWQERDVHGFSKVLDPSRLDWNHEPADWRGVKREDLIIYEMHVGTFSQKGDFSGATEKLSYLKELGITAIEVMPIGGVGCNANWGYDEVAKAAMHTPYGNPQDLANFVQHAHAHGLGVILDIVDNHMGPVGNYYWVYMPELWGVDEYIDTEQKHVQEKLHDTPWGAAFDLSVWEVATFFHQKNMAWQKIYRLDGFRRDAVHALWDREHEADPSKPHFLETAFRQAVEEGERQNKDFTIILENEHNKPSILMPGEIVGFQRPHGHAQWADDFHHAVRSLIFSDQPEVGFIDKGYYEPYTKDPVQVLAQILSKGMALDLETDRNMHQSIDEKEIEFDPRRSIAFTRNHDQIGNTPNGERIDFLLKDNPDRDAIIKAESTLLMLSPMIPMIFQGQELAANTPFPFFADWEDDAMRNALREGRKKEFPQYDNHADPCDENVFINAKLPWPENLQQDEFFQHYRNLIDLRKERIIPNLPYGVKETKVDLFGKAGLHVQWTFGNDVQHSILFNGGNERVAVPQPHMLARGTNSEIRKLANYESDFILEPWEAKIYGEQNAPAPVINAKVTKSLSAPAPGI